MEKISFTEALFNILIWCIFMFMNRYQINQKCNRGTNLSTFVIIVTLFSTFGFITGDYIHYRDLYNDLIKTNSNTYFEEFYYWLIVNLPQHYNIWRFAVWGSGTIIIALLFKRLKYNIPFATLIYILVLMTTFPNLRNALGYIVLYYGASYLLFPKNNLIKNFLFGSILITCSYFLHKSMFMYIILLLVSFIPFRKWTYLISLATFPILYIGLTHIAYFFLNSFAGDDLSQETGEKYLMSTHDTVANIWGMIQYTINRTPVFILLIYSIYKTAFKKEQITYGFRVFLQLTYILIYTSFLFLGQQLSSNLSPRFWDASLYPFCLFLIYYLYDKRDNRVVKLSLYLFILSNAYNLLYVLYKLI